MKLNLKKHWIFLVPLGILGIAAFIAAGGEIVRELWNWLLPPLFGWHPLTFWQALGVLALCRILFGGFGGHGRDHSYFRRLKDKRWAAMTPEERERFLERMRNRCGTGPSASPSAGQ